ncbi:MAG: hypothetical protein Q8L53_02140 [Aestuariivirga sp.]|nr:hypothetical protein [Aestuariivirga sp.]
MKTLIAISLAGLLLAVASAPSVAGDDKKNATQTHAATANQQVSIKLLRLRAKVIGINQ